MIRGHTRAAATAATATAVILPLALLVVTAAWEPARAGQGAAPPQPPASEVEMGRQMFEVACASCHGTGGEGTARGPRLIGVGAASADFQLTTGRMPLDRPRTQAPRRRPAYSPAEIRRLTAYVASLGPGPPIPRISPDEANLAEGNRLYANNCASCHSSAGAGGALGHSVYAPPLDQSTPVQIAEAIRVGPGAMPVFGSDTLDDRQVDAIVRYVVYLQSPDDRGGYGMGHLGPIPEGFVAWVIGLGALLLIARWIGTND